MTYPIHDVANIFPEMGAAEFNALCADIAANGLREAPWLYQGAVIDGRHRIRACEKLGIPCPTRVYSGDDPVSFVVSLNLHRRHLSESQRQLVAAKLATAEHGGDRKQGANVRLEVTHAKAAELLNVSERGVDSAKRVLREGADELVRAVESGKVSISAASTISEVPKEQQREIVARGEAEILEAAKQIRSEKAVTRRAAMAEVRAMAPPLPLGKFECVVIDPPWEMQKIERDVRPNQVAFEYPTMTADELATFDVAGISADDCHLFCWTTHKHLPLAIDLLHTWGFRYVCAMVWHKPGGFQPIGLPQYNCEFVLYARRGSPSFIDTKAFPCCFNAPRKEHSRKPDEFYDVIRRVTQGPRIDVFSRESREGFTTFGNEAGKFDGQ